MSVKNVEYVKEKIRPHVPEKKNKTIRTEMLGDLYRGAMNIRRYN
jgi:hypothetical protein